jgi:hypothetical protein
MTPGRAEDRSAVERLFTAEARYLPPVCDAAARTRGDPRLWVDDDEDGSVTTLAVGPVAVEGRDAVASARVRAKNRRHRSTAPWVLRVADGGLMEHPRGMRLPEGNPSFPGSFPVSISRAARALA